MPATKMTSTSARSFFTAYNEHDLKRMLAVCSDDAELRYVRMGSQGRGKAREVANRIWSGLIDAFPDLKVTVQQASVRNCTTAMWSGPRCGASIDSCTRSRRVNGPAVDFPTLSVYL